MTAPRMIFAAALMALIIGGPAQGSEAMRCVQGQLKALGYPVGTVDGAYGNKTFQAGEAYKKRMSSENPGWAMPSLTETNAEHWCAQVAAAHPAAQKFYKSFMSGGTGASVITTRKLTTPSSIRPNKAYRTELTYTVDGRGPVEVTEACFTWNGEGPYCFPPTGASKSKVSLDLFTGRPGRYTLNGAIKYKAGGKTTMSNWTSTSIIVK